MSFFSPTWQKFEAEQAGFGQFNYLFAKDVEPEWKAHHYSGLNEGRKMAVRFYWFKAELNNGGLPQYLWNSSGEFAADQIKDLATIGCADASKTLSSACLKIFGSDPPSDTTERRRQIQQYYGTHPFNDDDDKERLSLMENKDDLRSETDRLYEAQRSTTAALCSWFRTNPHFFSRLKNRS